MKESYGEGVANHSGPEPCEGGREAVLEALSRGICRPGMELRNRPLWGADGVGLSGRQYCGARQREVRHDPAESKTLSMRRNSMRENREASSSPVAARWRAGGRTR